MQSVTDQTVSQPAEDGGAFYLRGLMLLRDGDAEGAAEWLRRALRRQPGHAGMRRNLVRALLAAGRFDAALPQADAALALTPDDAELHHARGTALNALGQPAAACAAFHRALTLRPDHAPSWLNWGNAAAEMDDLEAAEALCRTAIRLDPTLAEAQASLAYALTRLGRPAEAVAACDAAIRLRPDFAEAHWNRAIALLGAGDLRAGFTAYEWRKRHPRFRADFPPLPGPAWDGGNPAWRTILLRAEQGFGDTIQFARYLALLAGQGARPVILAPDALASLLAAMPGVRRFTPGMAFDAWADLGSLPHLCGTTLASIPLAGGYLRADAGDWGQRLGPGRKVGLVLSGNPATPRDRRRSVPADLTRVLPAIAGVHFVNLQHGPAAARLPLPDLTGALPDFAATAALVSALDLVITVDTAVAHLAGALGRPVWLLLPSDADWRWLRGRMESPWYASMRLFRMGASDQWSDLLARVFGELAADRPPETPT